MRIRTDNQKLVQVQAIIDPRKVFRHHFPKSKYFYRDMDGVGRPYDIIQNLILMHKLIRIHGEKKLSKKCHSGEGFPPSQVSRHLWRNSL